MSDAMQSRTVQMKLSPDNWLRLERIAMANKKRGAVLAAEVVCRFLDRYETAEKERAAERAAVELSSLSSANGAT